MLFILYFKYYIDDKNFFEIVKDIILYVKFNWECSDIKFKVNIIFL